MRENSLILGIGNFDREDDGVAWHILQGLHQKLGRPTADEPYFSTSQPEGDDPKTLFSLQLFPEMAEVIAPFNHICFVDAHTGAIEEELSFHSIEPAIQNNPLTHHMTPETLLALTQTISGRTPEAILVSVRGYAFQYHQALSPRTAELAQQAVERIWEWLNTEEQSR